MNNDPKLDFKEKARRIFDDFFDGFQERNGFATIDDPVIIGQSEVHHRAYDNFAIECNRSLLNGVQS